MSTMSSSGTPAASTSQLRNSSLYAPMSDSEENEHEAVGNSGSPRKSEAAPSSGKGKGAMPPDQDGDAAMDVDGERDEEKEPPVYIDSDSDSDPDDPIVHSLPVFLTPGLTDSLALLQYPHRPPAPHTHHPLLPPALRPEEGQPDDRPRSAKVTARYKPKVGQLELSVPLEVREGIDKKRYNQDRAKSLGRGIQASDLGENGSGQVPKAVNGAGKKASKLAYEEGSEESLGRMTLAGDSIPDQTWYACAVVKDNEVHLTPLTRTMQMRAHLSYLDRIGSLARENAKRERKMQEGGDTDDDTAGSDDEDEGAKTAAEVAARKQKKQAASDKKRKEGEIKGVIASVKSAQGDNSGGGTGGDFKTGRAAASLFGPVKAAEQEAWVDLPFYDPASDEANIVFDKLFAQKQDKLAMVTKATSYLRL